MITCKDIARIAGVSTATITRAFNPSSPIKEDTRRRILQIAKEHNYTPNLAARGLKQRSSKTIGIILSDASNPYYVNVVRFIERRLEQLGYRTLISFADCDYDSISRSLEVMHASRVDGIIFRPEKHMARELIGAMQEQGTSFLQLYRNEFPEIDCILNNNQYGAYIGTQHLIECGHRRILFACQENDARFQGFWQAIDAYSAIHETCQVLTFGANDEQNLAALRQAFDRIKPTAIYAATHPVARIVFRHLWYSGYRIPQDVSLLVNDSLDWCEMLNISVIEHPYEEFANAATDLLIRRIQHASPKESHVCVIAPKLLLRNSIAKL